MKKLLPLAGYLVLYVLLDRVSYIHPVLSLAITPWNPQAGLSLAFLLLYGVRYWPAPFLAALAAEVLVRGIHAPIPYLVASSATLAGCYVGMAALLAGPLQFNPRFRRLRDLSWFMVTVFPGTLLAAISYVAIYTFADQAAIGEFFPNVLRLWVGDVIGVMVVTPFLTLHVPRLARHEPVRQPPVAETVAQALSIMIVLWIIFGVELTDEFKFFYLLFLPLIWIAMGRGIQGASLASLAIQVGLIVAVEWSGHKATAVLEFQLLMLTLAITGLFLGMAVSNRREAEERLRDQQAELGRALRLAGIGEMASALAHELNQPLSALSSYVRSCQLMLSMPEDRRTLLAETMDKAVREALRASQVVQRLRDFYRSGVVRREYLEPGQLLRGGIEALQAHAERHGIAVRLAVEPDLPAVCADPVQIEAVLNNLVSNAIDAIIAGRPKRREIRLEASVADRDLVRFCVADTGPGVPEEMRKRIFEPFATDKPEGTGLGLAISRSLVEANGGKLWLEEQQGAGARFCFTAPVDGERAPNHD